MICEISFENQATFARGSPESKYQLKKISSPTSQNMISGYPEA
jgi:hypothetical protein